MLTYLCNTDSVHLSCMKTDSFFCPIDTHIFTDNVNKALFELCNDVTVGWWSMYTCIIFFHAVVKQFALLVRFVSVNNPILFISVQSNLPQIINAEKPEDLFNVDGPKSLCLL